MKRFAIAAILAAAVAGCASTGVAVHQEQLAGFKKGITTEADVIRVLGKPNTSSMSMDGSRILAYYSAHYQTRPASFIPVVGIFAGGGDMQTTSTTFIFGPDGKLVSYNASESNYGTGNGIAAGKPIPQVDQPR